MSCLTVHSYNIRRCFRAYTESDPLSFKVNLLPVAYGEKLENFAIMKKFVLLTFMLLSGLALSAQNVQTYVYDSFLLELGTNHICEGQIIICKKLSISYNPKDSTYIIEFGERVGETPIICSYVGQLTNEKYFYSCRHHAEFQTHPLSFNATLNFAIYTESKLSSFLYNNGLDASSDNPDRSKVIHVTINGLNDFFIYPIKNKRLF